MSRRRIQIGEQFGKLEVLEDLGAIERTAKNGNKYFPHYWKCKCDCGNIVEVMTSNLTNGNTVSCGCHKKEMSRKTHLRHGKSDSRLYKIHKGMINRCENKNSEKYKNYGGRGITICPEWRESFEAFQEWAFKNNYQDNLTIDRIDVDKGYSPENCRWADGKSQANNTTKNRKVEINGEMIPIGLLAEQYGLSLQTIHTRVRSGDIGEDLIRPVTTTKTPVRNGTQIFYQGKSMTLAEAAKLSGINYGTLLSRYQKGERGDSLFRKVGERTNVEIHQIIVEFEDAEIPLKEAAKRSGIKYRTLLSRWRKGDRDERLFRKPENKKE